MDTLSVALVLGPLAAAIVMALGPGWQSFGESDAPLAPVPVRDPEGTRR
ncbi:MAG TPA: hypothetical protein VM618_12130 [Acidimicrobiia bacterium]|nr:hypothetical protein [Acidimicrobiia bacterium]